MVKHLLSTILLQNEKKALLIILFAIIIALSTGYIISLEPDWLRLSFDPTKPKHVYAMLLGLIAIFLIFKWPEVGLLGLVAIIFSNASEALVRYHSMPSLLQFLVPLLIMVVIFQTFISKNKKFVSDPMIVLLIIYGTLILVSSDIAENPSLADENLVEFLKNLAIFLVIINLLSSQATLRHTALVLLIVGALLGTISVYQVLTSSYGFEYGGFGRIKIAYIAGDYWEPRISGPLADPNFYAQTLIVLVPVGLLRILDESSLRLKIISAYSLLVLILAIIYTYSRGGALALGLVVALSLISMKIKFRYLLILLFVFAPLLIFIPSQFKSRLGTLEEFISSDDESKIHLDASFQQRILYMKTAWAMFSDNPILGVGSGNYSEYYDKYSEQVGSVVSSYENFGQRRFPHNLYLQIASETGVVGLTVFVAIVSLTLMYYYSAYKKFRDVKEYKSANLIVSFMIGFLGYLASSLFLHGDYIRYFWLLVAIAVAAKHISQAPHESKILTA